MDDDWESLFSLAAGGSDDRPPQSAAAASASPPPSSKKRKEYINNDNDNDNNETSKNNNKKKKKKKIHKKKQRQNLTPTTLAALLHKTRNNPPHLLPPFTIKPPLPPSLLLPLHTINNLPCHLSRLNVLDSTYLSIFMHTCVTLTPITTNPPDIMHPCSYFAPPPGVGPCVPPALIASNPLHYLNM
eukprot:CAMPEP_0182452988 /NCGR_PEP_ID=MMETSP1319-20130603/244_1 /TAXON_ID=172717 /ORGANISM="Bolidomonas pacifica, Strain RCC208" /LENGTH=185 /DNA_ID=CAMNT_0024650873 /DNA_START=290 /DNA_END=844 /DNA_ORIENTATION=+